jgi:hypothetical protein
LLEEACGEDTSRGGGNECEGSDSDVWEYERYSEFPDSAVWTSFDCRFCLEKIPSKGIGGTVGVSCWARCLKRGFSCAWQENVYQISPWGHWLSSIKINKKKGKQRGPADDDGDGDDGEGEEGEDERVATAFGLGRKGSFSS